MQIAKDRFIVVQQALGERTELFAGRGQRHGARVAVEQAYPDARFDMLDRLAERRLRHAELNRRLAKALSFGQFQEGRELRQRRTRHDR